MDLNAGQRKAIFLLIVVVLVGLGVYMFVPGARGSDGGHTPAAAGSSDPDIYQWLPFTQAQLGSATAVITQFCDAYGTWSYSQNATSYVKTMGTLIPSQLASVIEQGYSVPGVASQRTSKKQVSTGSTVINSIRAFGSSSITFVVTITEQITESSGQSRNSNQYAV